MLFEATVGRLPAGSPPTPLPPEAGSRRAGNGGRPQGAGLREWGTRAAARRKATPDLR